MIKRGQITLFVIIAIVLVAAVVAVFLLRDKLFPGSAQSEFDGVYTLFDSCVESSTIQATKIAGSQAGYIEVPDFSPGSSYAPFSSQLDFLGNPVPYWYYVSGNGVIKEQVPSKSVIENQFSDFIQTEIIKCDFSNLRKQGFIINSDTPEVKTKIYDERVVVSISMALSASKADASAVKKSHTIEVKTKFGELYNSAKEIYDKEKKEAFLENYAVDVMYNYAPATGVEFSCSPLMWNPQEVVDEIKTGISANLAALRNENVAKDKKYKGYFDLNFDSDANIAFIYDSSWPTRVEIWPAENGMMIAEPVGLEQGLGVIGFCYVPYHFVYDIYHPALIQVYKGSELFQFPVAVVVDKSVPRNSLALSSEEESSSMDEFCNYKNTKIDVFTYDNLINPVEADISFICLNEKCAIGKTKLSGNDAILSSDFPQCVNGRITASASGYETTNYYVSTNSPGIANIMMRKVYELPIEAIVGGIELGARDKNGIAVISFDGENDKRVAVYPQQKTIKLSEGIYNISVSVFSSASLKIPGGSTRKCTMVASPGILGYFGKKTEQCFDINIPEQTVSNALIAGGKTTKFILEDELKNSRKVTISVPLLPPPVGLEQLQKNYELLDVQKIEVKTS
ncbi:hypothetical protein J4463_01560 [Candidatus Pacearchaeota archaeon]|nr:hypothetical protein [Candidatus Pacearchaeota archaeon]